jgi:hypothetical protein
MRRFIIYFVIALLTFMIGLAMAKIWMNYRSASPADIRVVGRWTTDSNDIESLYRYGRIVLIFTEDGRCRFNRFPEWIDDVPLLSGKVQHGMILVEYPSAAAGREEIEYTLTPEDKLVVRSGSFHSTYVRGN